MTASLDFFAEDVLGAQAWSRSWEQDLSDPVQLLNPARVVSRPYEARVFDLASLTKVVVTGSLLVELAESEGSVPLVPWSERKLVGVLKELRGTPLESLSLRECWEHRSGLRPLMDFSSSGRSSFVRLADRSQVHARVLENALEAARAPDFDPSRATRYSDLGHALLGVYLERMNAKTIDVLWEAWKGKHLGHRSQVLGSLGFQLDNRPRQDAVATELRHPKGVVNDDNTYAMGGVASHAGLFGTARDLAAWVCAVYAWARVSPWARAWLETPCPEGQRFVLGWDTPSGEPQSQAGGVAAPRGVRGHLGYTGTAVWLDPELLRFGILLTNRVHPQHSLESQKSIQKLRWWCFEALWQGTLETGWKTGDKIGAGLIS